MKCSTILLMFYLLLSFVPKHVNASERELRPDEKMAIEKAVVYGLKDPESSRFRWPKYIDSKKEYCGYVNSKNSYGGYVGFRRFYVFLSQKGKSGKPVAAVIGMENGDPTSAETIVTEQTCIELGYGE
jgi:hypothetical protein